MSQNTAPVESKVKAGALGAAAGTALGGAALWLLGVTVWDAPNTAESANDAMAAVPGPVAAVVLLGVSYATSFAAGYRAKHTRRPDLGDHVAS